MARALKLILTLSILSSSLVVYGQVPTVTVGSPSVTETNSGPVTFTITYTDATTVNLTDSDVNLIKTGDADGIVVVSGSGTSTRVVTINAIFGDGTLSISIDAATSSNANGDDTGSGVSDLVSIDNTAPDVPAAPDLASGSDTGSSNTDNLTRDRTPTFNGTHAENGVIIDLYDGATQVGSDVVASGNFSITTSSNLADGVHNDLKFTATDDVGNVSANSPSFTMTIDRSKPSIVLNDDHPDDIVSNADNVIITAVITEANGIDGPPEISIGSDVSNANMSSTGDPLIWTYDWNVPPGNDGAANVSVTVDDDAGNASTAATAGTGPTSYTIDNIAPSFVSVNDTGDGTYMPGETITFDVDLGESGLTVTADLTVINSGFSSSQALNDDGDGTYSYTTGDIDTGGNMQEGTSIAVTFSATDVAGNGPATDNSLTLLLDKTSPSFVSGVVSNSAKDEIVVTFNDIITISNDNGFSVGGTSETINGVSGSGSNTLTFTLTGNVISTDAITLSYVSGSGNATDAVGNNLNSFTNSAISNNVVPAISEAQVLNANPDQLVATFDEPITLTDHSSFSLSGTTANINGIVSGNGTSIIIFSLHKNILVTDTPLLDYDGTDIATSLAAFSNFPVTNSVNAIPEPQDHVSSFTALAASTTSINLSWTESGNPQLPENYLIVGRDALSGSFAAVADGSPVANDSNWGNGNFAINVSVGTTSQPITGLVSGRNYIFRIYPYTNVLGSIDFKTSATVPQDNATPNVGAESIITGGSGVATMSSVIDTKGEALAASGNFTFTIDDDGASNSIDTAPTLIDGIIVHRDAANDEIGDWTNAIAGVVLKDNGSGTLNSADNPGSFSITADAITITNIPNTNSSDLGYVSDNGTKDYSLVIWLRSDLVSTGLEIDNKKLAFTIADTDLTVETLTEPLSSTLATSSAASGNSNNVIEVTATELYWKSVTGISTAHANFTIVVQATDANKNRDYNKTGLVVMDDTTAPSGGYLESEGHPNDTDEDLVQGQFIRTDMQVHKVGTYVFEATLSGLTAGVTGPHVFVDGNAQSDIIITAFNPVDNINYIIFQESPVDGNGTGDIKVAEFEVRDGGTILPTNDSDDAETALTDITFSLSNFANIRHVALHDGTSIVESKPAAANITFADIESITADDDGTAVFSLYVSFNTSVTDNDNFQFQITSAVSVGSTFATANAGGAASPLVGDDNRIEVTATQLDFHSTPLSSIQGLNTPILPTQPQVFANDANGSLDVDFNASAVVTTTATNTNAPTIFGNVSPGVLDFPSFQYTGTGNGTLSVNASGINGASNAIDVIHSTFTTLDLGAANTNDNNGIEAQIDLLATAVDKAILGFRLSAAQNTPNEPTLVDITVTFGNSISSSLTNLRLLSSTDSKYTFPETNVSNTTNVGADYVSFQSINIPLNASDLYYFVVADIAATANFASPAIFPKLEATGINLTSGTLTANIIGRAYTFKDTSPPEIASLVPSNGNNNFPQNGIISISFNEAVDAIDNIIHVYSLATDTLVSTLIVESVSGDEKTFFFNPDLPLAGSPLDGDIDYYILIPVGDGITKGFKDKSGNAYGGITTSSEWVFKTSDTVAPFFTTDLPSPILPAQAVNIIDKGFDLRIALDEPGKIFYIVVDQDVTTGTPTVDEIRNATFGGTINSGTADILRGIQYQYVSIFDDSNFPTGGNNFRVWITAEDLANPINKMVDGDPLHPGKKSVDGVFTSSPGSGLFIQNTPGNVPADICLGEHQLIFEPINIVEGSDNGFVSNTGQTINFILPPDFEFKTDNVNVIGQGGDISNVTFSFINSTILTVTYDINGTNDRDKLIISGLEVKALGNVGTSGDIIRLGGTGALSIADGDPLISFNTTQITPVEFITDPNTYSIGDENVFIPLLTPSLNALDKGTRLFSGPGVFGDTLYIAAAGLGTHTITFNYTNEIGCTSEFSLDRNIFDSDNAIVGLNSTYCTNDDPVTILFNARQNFSLDSLLIRVSDTQPEGIDTVDVFKVDAQGGVIISLDTVTGTSNYEFVPSRFINVDNFDKFTNVVDATNDGGLIGELTFTGIYQSLLNATQIDTLEKRVKIFYSPTSEIIIDGFNPIGDTLFDKGNTPPIITALSSLPGALEFCEDDDNIPLKGSSSSGFFSISMRVPNPADSSLAPIIVTDSIGFPGLVDNGDGSGFLQPQILVDSTIFSFGELELKFTIVSPEGGCNNSVAQTIRIHPKPIAGFIVPPVICEDTPITFSDNTGYLPEDLDLLDDNPSVNNTVVPQTNRWIWDFNDLNSVFNPATDTLITTSHKYEDPGQYNVNLSSISEFGCSADSTIQLIIGGLPTANFDMSGTSLNEEFKFISASDVLRSIGPFNHAIDSVAWDINGDGIYDIGSNDSDPTQNNVDTLNYNYADSLSFGTYTINFIAISTTGCSTSISPSMVVLANVIADSTAAGSYKESFTLDDGNWVSLPEIRVAGDTSSVSWAWGAPVPTGSSKQTILPGLGQAPNVWVTGLTSQYDSAEQSYIYSPAFDLRNLARPMIQLDIFKDLEEQDGVVFEYSTDSLNIMDSRKVWRALGVVDAGIEWFDAVGLAGSPGNDATGLGWTGTSNDTSWVTAKHSLGQVYQGNHSPQKIDSIKSRVLFRVGLGAIASATSKKTRDGFAFDNVFIGNRTRTVLLENFTSMAQGANTKFENDAINTLATSFDGTELIVLTYRSSFDGDDVLNLDNPSEPGARALYYGVSSTPRVAIDGKTGPDGSTNNSTLLFTDWGETFYGKRTLQIAPFEIKLELDRDNINDDKVRIFADITAKEDIDTSFVVHIAVVEKQILPAQIGISGLPVSGEDIFYNTLRKFLPNAAGTRFIGSIAQGSQISVSETWKPTNVVDPDDTARLQVVVFIQDEVSREILQSASINYTQDIVLAIEQQLSDKGIALYPNPADKHINIKLGEKLFKDGTAIIFDNTGKQIEEIGLQAGQSLIELSTINYRPGIYLFALPTETGAITKRFVIRRR